MNEEIMNTTEEMEEEVMSEETTDLVSYEDEEDEEPSDGAVALTVLGILGAGAAIGVAGKAIIDKIKAGKPKQPNTEKMTLRQKLAIKLAPELYLKEDDEKADTPFEDETDEPIEVEAEVHDIQETPKEEDKEVAEETTETTTKKKKNR